MSYKLFRKRENFRSFLTVTAIIGILFFVAFFCILHNVNISRKWVIWLIYFVVSIISMLKVYIYDSDKFFRDRIVDINNEGIIAWYLPLILGFMSGPVFFVAYTIFVLWEKQKKAGKKYYKNYYTNLYDKSKKESDKARR